jgi:DNA adenine methylase
VTQLVAPFPWFGGKRRVASLVWERFGHVAHYIEPFFGSGAVLLGAPRPAKVETINDLDGFVANFWRAVQSDPDGVARHADWPVNEADKHARHEWLIKQRGALTDRLMADPRYFDAEIAGWWVWGIATWIGTGWCQKASRQLPSIGETGAGVHALSARGMVSTIMSRLGERMRYVRVACGDWSRVLGKSTLRPFMDPGWEPPTGVFLDPPYSHGEHKGETYGAADCASAVAAWAREYGDRKDLRIALCGYHGEHEMPGWTVARWDAGSGRQPARNRENAKRETIWFSPHCLSARQVALFT